MDIPYGLEDLVDLHPLTEAINKTDERAIRHMPVLLKYLEKGLVQVDHPGRQEIVSVHDVVLWDVATVVMRSARGVEAILETSMDMESPCTWSKQRDTPGNSKLRIL